ncbi:hypothetical protein COS75_01235 [Candidatus Pacearchaeota archaeon CG06_land_8_20_14_3_00_35_12]|nr:MAG: hypothetical protein COS75_01235 [Candidatus Pacearchaeota archaeon CG06_land_8_20_14_3_00_35_12]
MKKRVIKKGKRIMIGLLGTIGSGKTAAGDYLEAKRGFYRVIMGNLVREVARKEGLEITRENLQKIQKKYRDKYGQEYFIKLTIKKLKESGKKNLLIDGIRTPTDARVAKENWAVLILIDAKPSLRYERIVSRGREGEEKTTLADFKEDEAREWKLLNFKETLKYADYKLLNNGNIKQLYSKIDKALEKILKNA